MICKWDVVIFLFMFVQLLYGRHIDVDPQDVKAKATKPVRVEGDKTFDGQYAFSVIFYEDQPRLISMGTYLSPICSGSVISSRWVLTTALPLGNYALDKYILLAGLKRISSDPDAVANLTDNTYRIEMMVVHPKWHEYDVNNVGMAKTIEPMKFGKELGTVRMPSKYNVKIPEGYNDTVCSLNIWASDKENTQHLMGSYQVVAISKQVIYLNIKKEPLKYCPDVVFTDKTLCLTQFDPSNPHDVCTVNLGAIVYCDCEAVGLFSGVRGKLDCVDLPPSRFTAVNISQYVKWITMVSEAPEPEIHKIHGISSAFIISLSFNIRFIYLCLLKVYF